MPYLWITADSEIQQFLGNNSTINIVVSPSDPQDYAQADAILWENYAVRYLTTWLSAGWEITEGSTPSDLLKSLAAEFTAALIGGDKLVTQFGRSGINTWVLMTLARIHQRVSSYFVNHATIELDETTVKKRMTFEQAQLASKTRSLDAHLDLLGQL